MYWVDTHRGSERCNYLVLLKVQNRLPSECSHCNLWFLPYYTLISLSQESAPFPVDWILIIHSIVTLILTVFWTILDQAGFKLHMMNSSWLLIYKLPFSSNLKKKQTAFSPFFPGQTCAPLTCPVAVSWPLPAPHDNSGEKRQKRRVNFVCPNPTMSMSIGDSD